MTELTPAEVRAARAELGWTRPQLARVLGVSFQAVRHWEEGRRPCRGPAAVLIGIALRLNPPKQ